MKGGVESCYVILDRNREFISPMMHILYRKQLEKAYTNQDEEVLRIYREMLMDDIFNYSVMKQVDRLLSKIDASSSPRKNEYTYEITSYIVDLQIRYDYFNKKIKQ